MRFLKATLFILVISVMPSRAADLFEAPEHYGMYTVSFALQSTKHGAMVISLIPPLSNRPHGPKVTTIRINLKERTLEESLPKTSSTFLFRTVSGLLNGYQLTPTQKGTAPAIEEKITVTVDTRATSGIFTFTPNNVTQWKKMVSAWNSIRGQLPTEATAVIPAL